MVMTRLRIGHSYLTHNYLMTSGAERQAPLCPTCNILFSISHILVDCPSFTVNRRAFGLEGRPLKDLLGENAPVDDIISFLKEIDLFYKI